MQPKYLKIGEMAHTLGLSADYLRNRQGTEFREGKHFFKKGRLTLWVVDEMVKWVESNEDEDPAIEDILSSLCA